jgi:membrane protein required for colicin V production
MNLLDIIIVAVLAFFLIRGIYRGFFREIGSLAGVILGIWVANLYQPQLTHFLGTVLPKGKFLPLISFALIFILILIGCNLLAWWLKMLFKKALLGGADRAMGAAVAVLKGVIIIYFVILLVTFFLPSQSPLIAQSRMAPVIITSYQSMVNMISPDAYNRLKERFMGKDRKVGNFRASPIRKASNGSR